MTDSALLDRVRSLAADVLQVPAASLTPASSPETVESWDSVRQLDLVLALEQAFGVQFEPEEIDQMKSIECIVGLLSPKVSVA
jgi:acyl carrier protein